MTSPPFHVLVIRSFLPLLRIAVGKAGIVHGSDVTQVAHDIHHFVVTQEAYDPPACWCRFFLECHHQVHDLARLGAAIQQVADLDERGPAACPLALLVYKTDVLENGDEVVKVIVDIADGDYGFRRPHWSLCWSRPSYHRRYQHHENRDTSAASRYTDRRADHFPPS